MYICIDVEADGPIPGPFSMYEFGAVVVSPKLEDTFYGKLSPISEDYLEECYMGRWDRKDVLGFSPPHITMNKFTTWIGEMVSKYHDKKNERIRFISDNNGYDYMWMCWYLHTFTDGCPFGHSSDNLRNIFVGLQRNTFASYKRYRRDNSTTKHTHHPVEDAKGNAEAFLKMIEEYNINISL